MASLQTQITKWEKKTTPIRIRVITACRSGNSNPDFHTCTIKCTPVDYFLGNYYDAAERNALDNGYEGPFVSYDEIEAPEWLFRQFFGDSPRMDPPSP